MYKSKSTDSTRTGRVMGQLCPLALPILVAVIATFGCADGPDSGHPTVQTQNRTIERAMSASSRYIVTFEPGRASEGAAAVRAHGSVIREIHGLDGVAASLPDAAVSVLQTNPNVALVELDPIRVPLAETLPYGVSMVQADQVDDAQASARTVCVIDSGYARGHDDLPTGTQVSGEDTAAGPWSADGCGHGTHVAGILSALGSNGVGVAGVNPSGTLGVHVVRVFADQCYWAYASDLIDAAYRCRDAGADVINMSLGCGGSTSCASYAEEVAFQDLYENSDILSVAAAGNDAATWYTYPASYPAVVSVAAVDETETQAWFSNRNDQVELAAPGVNVLSTVPSGCTLCGSTASYEYWSGTSMATPHVAGVAALIWSHVPTRSAAQIRQALQSTAKDIGSVGRDDETGHGLVQARSALDFLLGDSAPEPPPPTPECTVDSDCDDADPCTDDACSDGACVSTELADDSTCDGGIGICCSGICQTGLSSCSGGTDPTPGCGDGICEGGSEDGRSCPADCACVGKDCSKANCGDGVCEKPENARKCPVDCR